MSRNCRLLIEDDTIGMNFTIGEINETMPKYNNWFKRKRKKDEEAPAAPTTTTATKTSETNKILNKSPKAM